jgi:hypothetical protein
VAGSGDREQVGDERTDAGVDVVADAPDDLERLAGGVVELPVEVALAGEDRAGIAAAHRDDDVAGLHRLTGLPKITNTRAAEKGR